MNDLRSRVSRLLELREISQAEATRRSGLKNKQFINDIIIGKKKSIGGPYLIQLAKGLETTPDYLLGETDNPAQVYLNAPGRAARTAVQQSGLSVNENAPEIDKSLFPRDVPLVGVAACGDDAGFTLNGTTGDYVRRPPGLAGRRSVYALNIYGESMWPAYRHGELVYVDPMREPGPLEDAVIELLAEVAGEAGRGFLKRVVRVTTQRIICEQYNPHNVLTFERAQVRSFHRVIPWAEVLGY